MRFVWMVVLLAIALTPGVGVAATVQARTCAQADVQAAVTAAAAGDTVLVPAGTCAWSTTVTIAKAITLQGAGEGSTKITLGAMPGILVRTAGTMLHRVTGLHLTITQPGSIVNEATQHAISIQGAGATVNWRVDHVVLLAGTTSLLPYGIGVSGPTYGVIDHVVFDGVGTGVFVQEGVATDPTLYGDLSWSRPIGWGTANAVYVEDSTFIGRANNKNQVYDGRFGARIVFRHNTVENAWIEPHSGCPNGNRAALHNEIYANVFRDTVAGGGGMWAACRLRGGSAVIFDNTITDPDNAGVLLIDNQRSCLSCYGVWSSNRCDGTSSYDGNSAGQSGWPCYDQAGRGAAQASEPIYAWNNTLNGRPVGVTQYALCSLQSQHLVEGRDYYNGVPKPGYAAYTYPHALAKSGTVAPASPPAAPTTLTVR